MSFLILPVTEILLYWQATFHKRINTHFGIINDLCVIALMMRKGKQQNKRNIILVVRILDRKALVMHLFELTSRRKFL